MESPNLRKASQYINHLLLSRGLLRNDKAIDFLRSSADEAAAADNASAKIINLVHDLVLQSDREAESRERLLSRIHDVQVTTKKKDVEIERLQSRQVELQRQLALAQGQEETLKANARTAENAARAVREEMQRLRGTLQQVRAQCANDVRQRDVEIKRLKSHLDAKQRGTRQPPPPPPPPPASSSSSSSRQPAPARDQASMVLDRSRRSASVEVPKKETSTVPLDSPDYHLSQESSEFLAQLCQNLSDENESLIALVRSSLVRLRALQEHRDAQGPNGKPHTEDGGLDGAAQSLASRVEREPPTTYDALATEIHGALDHLQTILTNPSFVPLEEVEIREEEIARLRQGWEKMEVRWREAVAMMDSWHRRIADDGTLVNEEEGSLSPARVARMDLTAAREATSPYRDRVTRVASSGEDAAPTDDAVVHSPEIVCAEQEARQGPKQAEEPNGEERYQDSQILKELHTNANALIVGEAPEGMPGTKEPPTTTQASPGKRPTTIPKSKMSLMQRPVKTANSSLAVQKSRKRQASSEVPCAPPRNKLARKEASIEQKLEDARVEAEHATTMMELQGENDVAATEPESSGTGSGDAAMDGTGSGGTGINGAGADDAGMDCAGSGDAGIVDAKRGAGATQHHKDTATTAINRPRRKRNTLSPEELEYLLGIS